MIRSHPLPRMCLAAPLTALVLMLAACGSESDKTDEATTEAFSQTSTDQQEKESRAETESETATAQSEANGDSLPQDCERPSPKVVATIEEGLTVDGEGSLGKAYAVRSDDYNKVWMVAAEIEGEGLDEVIGVWATNDIRDYGSIYAAEGFARKFSDWGNGQTAPTDDGITDARRCLE